MKKPFILFRTPFDFLAFAVFLLLSSFSVAYIVMRIGASYAVFAGGRSTGGGSLFGIVEGWL